MSETLSTAPTFTKTYVRHGQFEYHPFVVKERIQVTPRYVRITLSGPAVDKLYFLSPDDDVRVLIPLDLDAIPGEIRVQFQPEYKIDYPEDAPPYEIKAYTIRRYDPDNQEIDLDVAIHNQGHGMVWAKNAQPGQTVLVGGAWGSFVYEGPMDHIVLIGDETALPAIGHWIERLQAPTSATVIAEVLDGQEHLEFTPPAGVDVQVHWMHRGDAIPGKNDVLESGVREHVSLVPNCLYWGAGESATLRTIRRYLVDELGVHRKAIQLGGYWKREDDPEAWLIDEDRL